jgi:CRISPR/Cas system-associated exonuclease Cas4 (RecB family)
MSQVGTPRSNTIILTENPRFRFSASSINLYLRCPRQFYFSRLLGFSTPSRPAAAFGIYLHRLLEELHRWSIKFDNRPSVEMALTEFKIIEEKLWPEFAEKLGPAAQSEAQREKAVRVIKEYISQEFSRTDPPVSTLYEEPLLESFKIGPYSISGRIDRIDLFPDGSAEIIDYKTGRRSERQNAIIKQFLNLENKPNWQPSDYQLPIYYFYWKYYRHQTPRVLAHYHLRDDKGVQQIRIEIKPGPVPASEQNKGKRTYLYEGDLERVEKELIKLLEEIDRNNQNFPPHPADVRECERCPFRFACEGPDRESGEDGD